MYSVFELNSADENDDNSEVKEFFVEDCENNEEWSECEKNDCIAVKIVFSWTQDMSKGQDEKDNCLHNC